MSILTRPILEINLNNLLDNYNVLSKIAEGSVPAAVIKDDAYGLGAQKIVSLLYEKANVRCFFVAHAIEAQELAENFKDAKFYVLQGIGEDSAEIFKKYKQLVPVISAPEMLSFWRSLKINDRKAVIQVETGLNRLGFRPEELKQLSNDLKVYKGMAAGYEAQLTNKDLLISNLEKQIADMKEDKLRNEIKANKELKTTTNDLEEAYKEIIKGRLNAVCDYKYSNSKYKAYNNR